MYLTTEDGRRLTTEAGVYLVTRRLVPPRVGPRDLTSRLAETGPDPTRAALRAVGPDPRHARVRLAASPDPTQAHLLGG